MLDFAGVTPNPARDKVQVRLPRGDTEEPSPPTRDHVTGVLAVLPSRYRLPLLVLDATGMRLGELEQLAWGDVDEPRTLARHPGRLEDKPCPMGSGPAGDLPGRHRARPTRRPQSGVARLPRFGGDRFRRAITRACTAAGVPTFSPHDLRHRRISLLHLAGVPWARIGEHVGQRNLAVTANTYTYVMVDEAELDYAAMI